MKRISTLILMLCCLTIINAQLNENTNQWIDYSKTYYKIKVVENGIYQIDFETLKANDIPMETISGTRLSLINEGKEVPVYVSNTNKWEAGDYLQFYGKKLDGKFDQRLYEDPDHQLHPYWSQFTDTATYFLSVKEPSSKIIEIKNDLTDLPEKENYFIYESMYLGDDGHFNGIPDFRLELLRIYGVNDTLSREYNTYFASYNEGEGWIGNLFAGDHPIAENFVTLDIPTPFVYKNETKANIQFKIVGLSNDEAIINDHYLKTYMNDRLIKEDHFEGYSVRKHELELPLHELGNEITQVKFEAVHPESSIDRQAASFIKIQYPRSFNFRDINHFAFSIDNKVKGNYIEFVNLLVDKTYWVYDLTHHLKLHLKYDETKQLHQVYLPIREGAEQRQLILQKENEIQNISKLTATTFTDYSLSAKQGNYIIITHPQLLGEKEAVSQYVDYRQSNAGGSHQVTLVNVEELYNQYSYGIRKHPLAIKYFLKDVLERWTISPRHCFLLGKGIKNSRCRNTPDNWHKNLVPTFGNVSNDQYFGSPGFDPLSYIAIGRLSATSETDIINYLDKVKQVEQYTTEDCNYLKEVEWKHSILQIGGGDDEAQQTRLAERLFNQANIAKNGSLTANSNYLLRGGITSNEGNICNATPKDCIADEFNQGVQMINFLGHSSGLLWEVNIGEPEDHNYNNRYPIMISQCNFNGDIYNSYVDEDMLSMPESWVHAKNAGATAFLGFSYFFEFHTSSDLVDEMFTQIYREKPEATLGEQINSAIHHHYNVNIPETMHAINQFTFSGDPALRYAINTKPELAISEEHVEFTIDQINDFYYAIDIKFGFDRLNIPANEAIPYEILLIGTQTEDVVSEGWLKAGETANFKGEFALLPEEQHQLIIQLDADGNFNEICEDNNSFTIEAGGFIINDVATSLDQAYQIKNYPNPFFERSIFKITLSKSLIQNEANLIIYNLDGQAVKQFTLNQTTKEQQIIWDGRNQAGMTLSAGTYWCQLKNRDYSATSKVKKIILLR